MGQTPTCDPFLFRTFAVLGSLTLVGGCGAPSPPPHSGTPAAVATEHLPNVVRLHPQVLSGGAPEGEAGFAELARLGVRTVLSVDGARPDIAAAGRHGLRYVHLPHGYDGISPERGRELAKAVRDLPGPIYVHCHHGRHRSPAAAAVACVANGWLTPDEAQGVLSVAGTSPHYRGLHQAVASTRRMNAAALDATPVEFREVSPLPPRAQAMVEIERLHDRLQRLERRGWRALPTDPDLDPAHEALLFREQFTELLRREAEAAPPTGFIASLRESEAAAVDLEAALRDKESGAADRANAAWARAARQCDACHRAFRDVPRGE